MKILPFILTLFVCSSSLAHEVKELLYMGKYWKNARASYNSSSDEITIRDAKGSKVIRWASAPESLRAPFIGARDAAQRERAARAQPKPLKLGSYVAGEVMSVHGQIAVIYCDTPRAPNLDDYATGTIAVKGVSNVAVTERITLRATRTEKTWTPPYGEDSPYRLYEAITSQPE